MISNIQHIPSFTPKNDCSFENKIGFKSEDQPFFNFDYSFCTCSDALQYTNSLDSVKNCDAKEQENNKPFYNLEEQFQALLIKVSLMGRFRGAFISTDAGSGIGSGNDTGIGSLSPELVEQRHFDAWGGLVFLQKEGETEAAFFSEAKYDEELYLDRGYTGHEHLASVSLIHMNGRLYDAKLRRFLAPDNFIQDPYNTQNFNRYAYVYNNPLIYNDPSGEFIGSLFTGIFETYKNIFKYGVNFDNYSYSRTKLAWKIDMGMFKGNFGQIAGKWTTGLVNNLVGSFVSHGYNITGNVNDVTYLEGAIALDTSRDSGAFSLGYYINGPRGFKADWKDHLFVHEYGHSLQSNILGPLYLVYVAPTSLLSAAGITTDNHLSRWFEVDASRRGAKYFDKRYGRGADDYYVDSPDHFDINSYANIGARSPYNNPRNSGKNFNGYQISNASFNAFDLSFGYGISRLLLNTF